jgi:hypothetical protein
MTPDHRIGPDGPDGEIARALRAEYAAPEGELYWRGLHARIMARVGAAAEGEHWSSPLARWARVGGLAAAVAILFAGVTLWREREARARYALDTVLLQSNGPHAQLSAAAGQTPDDDAVLHYLLTP